MKSIKENAFLKTGGGIAGLLVVAVIVVAANILLGAVRMRADLTAEKLYTLSDGTINLLKKVQEPVTLKLYFSSSSTAVPPQLKTYARQVEDLLREYQRHSGGNIAVEKADPKPDSDSEEWAQRYGVAAQNADMFGPPVYFGLVAICGETEAVIPAFDPSQEELLEYNITRLVYRVTHPEKPVIGVISSLPIMGTRTPPMGMMPPRGQQQPPWVAIQTIRQDHNLRELTPPVESIPDDIDALLVVHPKDLDDQTLYAIDQAVLKGKHLLMMVDPLSIADEGNPMTQQFGMPSRSSNAERLLKAWGVGFDAEKIVADIDAATNVRMQDNRVERSLVALSLATNNISRKDILTTQLDNLTLPYAGSFADNTGGGLTFVPLLYSSDNAGPVSAMTAQFGGQAVQREFKDAPTRLNLAVRLSGNFKTAFPEGAPRKEGDTNATAVASASLTNGTSTVVLVADTDMIFNPVCVEEINMFGFSTHRERNDNLSFFANAVEMIAGSQDLVSVRSRGRFGRPFDRVLALQAKAMKEWQGREQELEKGLRETERQLQEMQSNKDANQKFILSREQQEAIANFRKEELRIKKELKDVRKNLRAEIESLGTVVKVINIGLVPLLVSLAGMAYGLRRHKRG